MTLPQWMTGIARGAVMLMLYIFWTKQQSLWLFYLPFVIMLCCGLATLIYYWHSGNRKKVWINLLKVTLVLILAFYIGLRS
jgi:hypothetical protein